MFRLQSSILLHQFKNLQAFLDYNMRKSIGCKLVVMVIVIFLLMSSVNVPINGDDCHVKVDISNFCNNKITGLLLIAVTHEFAET